MKPSRETDGRQLAFSADISGLKYLDAFITETEEERLVARIDADQDAKWDNQLSRRVQHYGIRYDYRARSLDPRHRIGPLPDWLRALGDELVELGCFDHAPEQAIVNEYQPGQGIAEHVDHLLFGPAVASLSLLSPCVMDFRHPISGDRRSILLRPRSLVVLASDARYRWKHGIAKRNRDRLAGAELVRQRRLSITFRTVQA